ncbi:MAG: hypothetical protein ACLFUS_00265 [Candidatus Sumerlaeia bacterium]
MRKTQIFLILVLTILAGISAQAHDLRVEMDEPSTDSLRRIEGDETAAAILKVQERTEKLRGWKLDAPVPAYYLDSNTIQKNLVKMIEEEWPEAERKASEAFLKSLGAMPEDMEILNMYIAFLDEQAGGLYDQRSKKLFVREGYDIVGSAFAQMILAHEICHAIQDRAFDLEKVGIQAEENDDRALAALCMAEGDAMLLMQEYAAHYASMNLLEDAAENLFMDQSALEATPHFFKMQLIFPYTAGQAFLDEARKHMKDGRNHVFREPPVSTEQVIHSEKYFGDVDLPSSLTLREPEGTDWNLPENPAKPEVPAGFKRVTANALGEVGMRALFEDRLGAGIAYDAAEGWDGDFYVMYQNQDGRWWFAWESAWDSETDAREFLGALVTHWRSVYEAPRLGSLSKSRQAWQMGKWKVQIERAENRVMVQWLEVE